MTPENWFQGAASETEPPEATFDLEPALAVASAPGLALLLLALNIAAWACLPAVVILAWRAAL
jgi:hypothetical protein